MYLFKTRNFIDSSLFLIYIHNLFEEKIDTLKTEKLVLKAIKKDGEISPDGLNSDIHASAVYRANLIKEMAKR